MAENAPINPARAAALFADLLEQLDDANPDVGMGPGRSVFVSRARAMLGLDKTTASEHDVAIAAKNRDKVVGELTLAVEKALSLGVFAGERLPSRVWKNEYEPVFAKALDSTRRAS